MAHRGRLNVLTNFMKKPYIALFSEFQGNPAKPEDVQGSGDVKYHLGTSADREFDGNVVHLSLTANPSHLEVVDPVVLGKVRAKQTQRGDDRTQRGAWALLIHGDAAFAGQGVVARMLRHEPARRATPPAARCMWSSTTRSVSPRRRSYSRSGPYCTDVAKMVQAPIFHVNGDDPEAVVHAARIAIEFRQEFKTDVVVDMVCYRRHGHNEGDEPAFTQPLMYRKIAAASDHPPDLCREAGRAKAWSTPDDADQLGDRLPDASGSRFRRRRNPTRSTRPIGWRANGPASAR